MISLLLRAVVERHVERAADGNDDLLACPMGMSAATFAGGNVVGPIDALDVERDVQLLFGHGQVASGVEDLRQLQNLSYRFLHILITLFLLFFYVLGP